MGRGRRRLLSGGCCWVAAATTGAGSEQPGFVSAACAHKEQKDAGNTAGRTQTSGNKPTPLKQTSGGLLGFPATPQIPDQALNSR